MPGWLFMQPEMTETEGGRRSRRGAGPQPRQALGGEEAPHDFDSASLAAGAQVSVEGASRGVCFSPHRESATAWREASSSQTPSHSFSPQSREVSWSPFYRQGKLSLQCEIQPGAGNHGSLPGIELSEGAAGSQGWKGCCWSLRPFNRWKN